MQSVEKTSDTHTLWHPLHQACAHCIELARDLGRRLQAGDAGLQLQPLLEESAAQIGHLRQGIRDLARRGERVNPAEREQLLVQMRLLLDLEEQNHALLSAKGIRLNTPHSYRYKAGEHRH
jgi:hypothetical protein